MTSNNPLYTMTKENGTIMLDGGFRISGVHNHYPSAGNPQSFGAVIDIKDKSKQLVARVKFLTPILRQAAGNQLHEIIEPPTMVGKVLQVPQPLSSLPLWQMVLTQFPPGSYYIAFEVNEKESWAFLTPTSNAALSIGPPASNQCNYPKPPDSSVK